MSPDAFFNEAWFVLPIVDYLRAIDAELCIFWDDWLRLSRKKCGPIFTATIAGSEMIFVVCPKLLQHIYREPST